MFSTKIHALLFASPKPLTVRQLVGYLDSSLEEVTAALQELAERLNTETSGVHVLIHAEGYSLVTNPACTDIVRKLEKEDTGELTRPALETLTVLAYRSPLTRAEIEAIRGVQCALILRNLLMRGLIVERDDALRGEVVYTLSGDTLRYLGVHSEKELPDYEVFRGDERLTKLVDALGGL